MRHTGKLVVFEGPEGSGKTTMLKKIVQRLRNDGVQVVATKEPGSDLPRCREIRQILLDPDKKIKPERELDLFIEDRAHHFENIVIPALKNGFLIFMDRSSPSTIAYQHYGRGMDLTDILIKDAKARQNVGFDLIILFDLDPEIGLTRKNKDNRFEKESLDFHRRVRAGYLRQANEDPDHKWLIVDANLPIDDLEKLIFFYIRACFRLSDFKKEDSYL